MKKLLNAMVVKARMAKENFFKKENGDTNFISILVVLAIVMVVAGTFIAFKDRIIGWVNDSMPAFFNNNATNPNSGWGNG